MDGKEGVKMKVLRRLFTAAWVVLSVVMLAGCGSTATKEFKSPNETYTIQASEKWNAEDIFPDDDRIMSIFSPKGDNGIVSIQSPKSDYTIADMDGMKDAVETFLTMNSPESVSAPTGVPGMENITAYKNGMMLDGYSMESYTVYGETDYAFYAFVYIDKKVTDKKMEQFQTICASFVENAPEVENQSTVEATDTIRWFNTTCAILTSSNGWDYNIFGGMPANEESKQTEIQLLEEWWEVTDRQSADETMNWLLTEGHRADFVDTMEYYAENGVADIAAADRAAWLYENFEMTEEEGVEIAEWYNLYEEQGENAIAAWDYSRAMSLLGYYFLAGYYTEAEALDKSLEVATTIQGAWGSWDEFMEGYFKGYEWWSAESSDERRALYEELKAADDNPYAIDWNLSLEKSW